MSWEHVDWEKQQAEIIRVISTFPTEFKLDSVRDGDTGKMRPCRLDRAASFFSGDTLWLYVEAQIRGEWLDYAKATENDIRRLLRG